MLKILGSFVLGVSAQVGMGDRRMFQSSNFGGVNLPTLRNLYQNSQESQWQGNLVNLYRNEKAKCAAKAEPGQRVTFAPMCLDKELAQISNGGLGCIEENSIPTGCRYCEFDVYSEIPCEYSSILQNNFNNQLQQFRSIKADTIFQSDWRSNLIRLNSNEKMICAAKAQQGQRVTFDPMCLNQQLAQTSNKGLGCIEENSMPTGCRYCEFGAYSEIPCDWTRQMPLVRQGLKDMFSQLVNDDDDDDDYDEDVSTFLLRPTTATQGKLVYWLSKEGGIIQDPVIFTDEAKIGGATTFANGVAQVELYKPSDLTNVFVAYKTWEDSRSMWSPVVKIPITSLMQLPQQ